MINSAHYNATVVAVVPFSLPTGVDRRVILHRARRAKSTNPCVSARVHRRRCNDSREYIHRHICVSHHLSGRRRLTRSERKRFIAQWNEFHSSVRYAVAVLQYPLQVHLHMIAIAIRSPCLARCKFIQSLRARQQCLPSECIWVWVLLLWRRRGRGREKQR